MSCKRLHAAGWTDCTAELEEFCRQQCELLWIYAREQTPGAHFAAEMHSVSARRHNRRWWAHQAVVDAVAFTAEVVQPHYLNTSHPAKNDPWRAAWRVSLEGPEFLEAMKTAYQLEGVMAVRQLLRPGEHLLPI